MSIPIRSLLVVGFCVSMIVVDSRQDSTRAQGGAAEEKEYTLGIPEKGVIEDDYRHRRAVTSINAFFLKRWQALLKTTIGSTFGINEKAFIKVGTMDDAMKDFVSFRPKGIFNDARPGSLKSYVGNQVIEINTCIIKEPVITITTRGNDIAFAKQKHRSIYYFESKQDAMDHLYAWKNYGLRP